MHSDESRDDFIRARVGGTGRPQVNHVRVQMHPSACATCISTQLEGNASRGCANVLFIGVHLRGMKGEGGRSYWRMAITVSRSQAARIKLQVCAVRAFIIMRGRACTSESACCTFCKRSSWNL